MVEFHLYVIDAFSVADNYLCDLPWIGHNHRMLVHHQHLLEIAGHCRYLCRRRYLKSDRTKSVGGEEMGMIDEGTL